MIKWRDEHREQTRRSSLKSRNKNLEKRREASRIYRKLHLKDCREKGKLFMKEWRQRDPEAVRAIDRKYYNENAIIIREKEKENRKQDPERYRRYDRKQYEKMISDVGRRVAKYVSNSLWFSIKENKSGKAFFSSVPYTKEDLCQHLASLWEDEMTWENYGKGEGKWSIDHKVPSTFFHFTTVDDWEFKECWKLENLQPMWDINNSKKGNKTCFDYQQNGIKKIIEKRGEICELR